MRPWIKRDATHNTKTPKKKNYEKVQTFGEQFNKIILEPFRAACSVGPLSAALRRAKLVLLTTMLVQPAWSVSASSTP